jgi:hypothetical protein
MGEGMAHRTFICTILCRRMKMLPRWEKSAATLKMLGILAVGWLAAVSKVFATGGEKMR